MSKLKYSDIEALRAAPRAAATQAELNDLLRLVEPDARNVYGDKFTDMPCEDNPGDSSEPWCCAIVAL